MDLASYLKQLRLPLEEPSLEPELDDKDEKKDREMRYVQQQGLSACLVRATTFSRHVART